MTASLMSVIVDCEQDVPAAQPDLEAAEDSGSIDALNSLLTQKALEAAEDQEKEVPGEYMELVGKLRDCLETGKLDPRSAVGQRFAAYLAKPENSEFKAEYLKLQGAGSTKAKQDFRLKWAEGQVMGITRVSKRKLEEVEEEQGEVGRYMAFDKLCVEEGGLANKEAVKRATAYAMECVRRGAPYLRFNSWKQCTELLVFESIYKSMHRKKHSMLKEEYEETKTAQVQIQAEKKGEKEMEKEIETPHAHPVDVTKPSPKKEKQIKGNPKTEKDKEKSKEKSKEKNNLKQLMKQ
eukprot:11195467-Lingulodinium_polyedra.AAC.1